MKALIVWSLGSSEVIQTILKESYKQQRHDDDLNQPLSVQPWGKDGDKRRYWLIEGQDDTHFRLYRESNPALKHNIWMNVAGSINELKAVADRLGEEGSQASRRLKERILAGVPRFEASEDVSFNRLNHRFLEEKILIFLQKRKRRDYRNSRKAQFTRPEPGFSLYEGRTRGKRIKYTFSDEEELGLDVNSTKRSNRQSGTATPNEPTVPTFTASGRQVRIPVGGLYGQTISSGQNEQVNDDANDNNLQHGDENMQPRTRTRGGGRQVTTNQGRKHIEGYNELDEMEDESDATSSGNEWDGGDDDELDGNIMDDEEEDVEMSDSGGSYDEVEQNSANISSFIVTLKYRKKQNSLIAEKLAPIQGTIAVNGLSGSPASSNSEAPAATNDNSPRPENHPIPKMMSSKGHLPHQKALFKPLEQ